MVDLDDGIQAVVKAVDEFLHGAADLAVRADVLIGDDDVEDDIRVRRPGDHAEVVQRQLEDLRLLFAWQIQNQL